MTRTYKVKLHGSDGKEYVTTYEGLWKDLKQHMTFDEKLGWNGVTKGLREDVTRLRDLLLSEILIPKAKTEVLKFLKENPDVQTRSFYHKAWSHGERINAWYYAKQELEAQGLIVPTSHGAGHNRTWNLKKGGE